MSIARWAWEKPEWSEMYPSATTFRLENLHLKMLFSGSDITVWQIQEVNILLLILLETFPNGHKEILNMGTNYNILHFRCLMETQSLSNSLRCQEFHKAPKIPARAQILYSKQHKST
jgi:hypothetical protein